MIKKYQIFKSSDDDNIFLVVLITPDGYKIVTSVWSYDMACVLVAALSGGVEVVISD